MFRLLAANLKVGKPSLAPLSVSYPRHPWCQQRRRGLFPCSQERGRAVLNPSLLPCRLQPLPLPLLSRRRDREGSGTTACIHVSPVQEGAGTTSWAQCPSGSGRRQLT